MSDTQPAEHSDREQIAFECDLPEPPEKVWRALTTPEIVSEWLLPTDLQPVPGAEFTFEDIASGDGPIECEVISVEHQRSISFGWRDGEARRNGLASTVTFEIAQTEQGGTHLRVLHEVRHAGQPSMRLGSQAVTATAANDNRISLRLVA